MKYHPAIFRINMNPLGKSLYSAQAGSEKHPRTSHGEKNPFAAFLLPLRAEDKWLTSLCWCKMVRRDKSVQFHLLLSLLQVITNNICCLLIYLSKHLCQCIPLTEIWYTMCYQANNNCSKIKLSVHFAWQAFIISVGTWPSLHNFLHRDTQILCICSYF